MKHACVHDRYARRIDRFFDWNPSLANDYLEHPHFEVRAIAAKFADVFRAAAAACRSGRDGALERGAALAAPLSHAVAQRSPPRGSHPRRLAAREARI